MEVAEGQFAILAGRHPRRCTNAGFSGNLVFGAAYLAVHANAEKRKVARPARSQLRRFSP